MQHDGLFLFLEPSSDPAVDRVVLRHDGGGSTLLVWAPDGELAARVAETAVTGNGVRLIELYRGFDLAQAARVVEQVVPRAPVATASYELGATVAGPIRRSATIYHDPDADPSRKRVVREHGDGWTVVVGAPLERMAEVAEQLVDDGAQVVEICGGAELTAAAAVRAGLGDRVPVSLVSWPFESLEGATAYKTA